MTPVKPFEEALIYQLKITLKGIRPPIWRRIQVAGNAPLSRLHRILQIVMGWEDYHLHSFSIDRVFYGKPEPGWEMGDRNEKKYTLASVVSTVKEKFLYIYDFGDDWIHEILVEKILPPGKEAKYPVCLAGKRACPPEDSGGVWGYAQMLEIMQDPKHEEYDSLMEWLGDEFDPETFDPEKINAKLRKMKR